MPLPIFNPYSVSNRVLIDIIDVTKNYSNDMDLGEAVRKIITNYKEGVYNQLPPTQLNEDDGN